MKNKFSTTINTAFALCFCLVLGGCITDSSYQKPTTTLPTKWAAPLPHNGKTANLLTWWQQFNDPTLTALIHAAEATSPTLEEAWANILAARANYNGSVADLYPEIGAGATGKRTRSNSESSGRSITNTISGELDASWEIDLFGKTRAANAQAKAKLQAKNDDWHDARISLAAEVADTYVQYRACTLLSHLYDEEAASQKNTFKSTQGAVTAGLKAPSDGVLAKASASSSLSEAIEQEAKCAIMIKSLVNLTGIDEEKLRIQLAAGSQTLPITNAFQIDSVPAALINQRPDLASLERAIAAAHANINKAEADRYPTITLAGTITRAGTNLSSLLTSWLLSSAASLPIFDGGGRQATINEAKADYLAAAAQYKQGVRTAIQEVEEALVNLDAANRRASNTEIAADQYKAYFETIDANWQAGLASMIDREAARRDALSAEVSNIEIKRNRIQYWIALYKALGGGWSKTDQKPHPTASQKETQHG